MPLPVGTRLGPYEIRAPLGVGGMGEVYRARDTRLDRDVAIKILPAAFGADPDRRARFEREAKVVATLTHPNVVVLHDCGNDQGVAFAVMELLEGESLRQRLINGALPWRHAVEIGSAVADGLSAAHAKGIIHRDLKPENLFLTNDGRAKVLDFGLARLDALAAPQGDTSPYQPAPTQSGTVMGTVGYMSPEQVRGQPVDARSDIFSLGCVLYEMVTGRRPFQRDTAAETQTAILREEAPPLSTAVNRVPPEVERVVRHCMEKGRDKRFQNARDLAFALRATLADSTRVMVQPPMRSRAGVVWGAMLVGLVAAAAIGIAAFAQWSGHRHDVGNAVPPSPPMPEQAAPVSSIAILPFTSDGIDAETAFLSDGITWSLSNSLSQVRRLKVRPFSSVSAYKGKVNEAAAVGKALKVEAIITGSIQKRGSDLVVTMELVDVRDNHLICSERYNRQFANLLAVQEEIAKDLAAKLRLQLTGEEQKQLVRKPTESLEAFRLHVLGRVEWNKRTESGFKRGIEYFEQALKEDPQFALAWSGIADCYSEGVHYGYLPFKEAMPKAEAAARHAIALDDALAEAHVSLGNVFDAQWDWRSAEREFKRALELNPNYATGHQWYASHLASVGRLPEAAAEAKLASALDPQSVVMRAFEGCIAWYRHQPDQAIDLCRQALAMDSNFAPARDVLSCAYQTKGMKAEAIAEAHKLIQIQGDSANAAATLAAISAAAGDRDAALKYLEQAKRGRLSPVDVAMIHACLGEKEQALTWLEKACAERDIDLDVIDVHPYYDGLRSEPRFQRILEKMGLRESGAATNKAIDTVAVLPFENQSTDPEAGYLGDDITFSLTESLGRFRDLKVRSFSSAARYKDKPPLEAGKDLKVQAVLKGAIQKRGEDVVIFVELIAVQDDQSLWKNRYQGKFAERLALQQSIVEDIPGKLRRDVMALAAPAPIAKGPPLPAPPAPADAGPKLPTTNLKAHELYVKGRLEWNKRSAESLKKGIGLFEQALQEDPKFAQAWCGIADCYRNIAMYEFDPPQEALTKAKAAAHNALAMDETLAEAHVSLGGVLDEQWEWVAAGKEFQRALELSPNHATAHFWNGAHLSYLGRWDEALAEAKIARELDPQALIIRTWEASLYWGLHQPDRVMAIAREVLAIDPSFAVAREMLAGAYEQKGLFSEALAEVETLIKQRGPDYDLVGLAITHALAGRRAEALRTIEAVKESAKRLVVSATDMAQIYASLNDKEEALTWLEKACAARENGLKAIKVNPYFHGLHAEPRFQAIIKKMNLPPG